MTTSLKISKGLAAIGFEAKGCFFWFNGTNKICEYHNPNDCDFKDNIEGLIPSYDLETIIKSLPYVLGDGGDEYFLTINQHAVAYTDDMGQRDDLFGYLVDDESLADTAARLLIKLFKAGIINFNKSPS
jgi:hypothetical protein